jgi:hypothetical protein
VVDGVEGGGECGVPREEGSSGEGEREWLGPAFEAREVLKGLFGL